MILMCVCVYVCMGIHLPLTFPLGDMQATTTILSLYNCYNVPLLAMNFKPNLLTIMPINLKMWLGY